MDEDAWALLDVTFRPSERAAEGWLSGLGFNRAAPGQVLFQILGADRADFLFRDDLPDGIVDAAVVHPARRVRSIVMEAKAAALSAEQWDRLLAATPESRLRDVTAEEASYYKAENRGFLSYGRGVGHAPHRDARPPATPAEIAEMASTVPEIDPDSRTTGLWWVGALFDNAEAMRQLAASPSLWIRRSVARAPHLPEDVVDLLAHDQDRVVRLFLAESCDDAPPEMLLEVWRWWSGSLSFPGRPRTHPNFPRRGLLRFADDPDARMRLLALDDPASDASLTERFSRDPDAVVRAAAAADSRLSPESATRLADDRDSSVRHLARCHPALPTETLVRLLLDERSAKEAAYNPAIPPQVMQRIVALAAASLRANEA
jgi:hypothetical protein